MKLSSLSCAGSRFLFAVVLGLGVFIGMPDARSACEGGAPNNSVEGAEECDDGNQDNTDACLTTCVAASCGDAHVQAGVEDCEDGDTDDGDGCSSVCIFEAGYTCLSVATCNATCGTVYAFTSNEEGWSVADSGTTGGFAYGTSSIGNAQDQPGFETAVAAALVQGERADTTIEKRMPVPTVGEVANPDLVIHYYLDVDQADASPGCLEIYIDDPAMASPAAETLCDGTPNGGLSQDANGFDIYEMAMDANAGTVVTVTLRYIDEVVDIAGRGVFIDRVELRQDADADGTFEFTGMNSCDQCIDADQDGYGSAASEDRSTCVGCGVIDCSEEDCDDTEPDINSGEFEFCTNGKDDNCDGEIDAADDQCDEDCANGIDDGGNGTTDCDDSICEDDIYCDACTPGRAWSFETGPGLWTSDKDLTNVAEDVWLHVGALGGEPGTWGTGGDSTVFGHLGSGTHRGHLTLTIDVPASNVGGPEPILEVEYKHSGDDTVCRDVFGICLNNENCSITVNDCNGDASVVFTQDTPSPGGNYQTITVPLTDYIGTSVKVSFLYDTVDNKTNANQGVFITKVRVYSDTDADNNIDTDDPACDSCWDADADGYGHPDSPDLNSCTFEASDCDDQSVLINPGKTEVCNTPEDDDCDGDINGFDVGDCGVEDCANGLDDNGDGNVDCDDPVCAGDVYCEICYFAFDFDTGEAAWTASSNLAGSVFEHGVSQANKTSNTDKGWETGLNADVSDSAIGQIIARISRVISVPIGMPDPAIEITYNLSGDNNPNKDLFAVCIGSAGFSDSSCDGSSAQNHDLLVSANTVGNLDTAVIALPPGSEGQSYKVVLVYDTMDGSQNNNAGLYIAEVKLRSDTDGDGLFEFNDASCDQCIDADGDGYANHEHQYANHPFHDVSSCTGCGGDCTQPDCDDTTVLTKPEQFEDCNNNVDNNCDGVLPIDDNGCSACGDGLLGEGEICDDGNDSNGDGCDTDCKLEAAFLYISEIHLPQPAGYAAEQWIEIHHKGNGPLSLTSLDLRIRNQIGDTQRLSTDCTILTSDIMQSGDYFVIGLGPANQSDFGAGSNGGVGTPDAVCSADFTLSQGGDKVELRAGNIPIDSVDYSGFTCGIAQDESGSARSFVLIDAGNKSNGENDSAEAWCLAGPNDDYSNSGNHRGSPGEAGDCAEWACDGVDDDCDGTIDESLPDFDADGLCDDRDCLPQDGGCAVETDDVLCTDSDNDAVMDCLDGCIDADNDGYGVSTGIGQGCIADDCNDDANNANAGVTEDKDAGLTCADGIDNDCDLNIDCADDGCSEAAICNGEACDNPTPILCGQTLTVSPATNDTACAAGVDAVQKFSPVSSGLVTFEVENVGSDRFSLTILEGACSNDCGSPVGVAGAGCGQKGSKTLSVTGGTDYFLIVDAVASCGFGLGDDVEVTVKCAEACDACPGGDCSGGSDEDADGKTDCEDFDCAGHLNCADYDTDGDGVTNAVEILCGTSPTAALDTPSFDDQQDVEVDADGQPDPDGLINCVDDDDDNDGFSDEDETKPAAQGGVCYLNPNAKNDPNIYLGAPKNCAMANVDADCNEKYDYQEGFCGAKELNCKDGKDGDEDGPFDCADVDCVEDTFCTDQDYDEDGVSNGFEIYCATDPADGDDTPSEQAAGDPDTDGIPNCADFDDDGDGFEDVEEIICGADPLDPLSQPTDWDNDNQCDASDLDDDNDGAFDLLEAICGSDPLDDTSSPTDLEHDLDQDGICNLLDSDDDGDGWLDLTEQVCGTDPMDGSKSPDSLGLDVDGDGVCDALDPDDDNDGWSDNSEAQCGTDKNDDQSVPADANGDGVCDNPDLDQDGDGWPNTVEETCGTDPFNAESNPTKLGTDADNDKICDALDMDDDGDGWEDAFEVQCETDPNDDTSVPVDTDGDKICDLLDADDDNDGWQDLQEEQCLTLPLDDTSVPGDHDNDGMCDAIDPEADYDGDGWVNSTENFCATDPISADSMPTDIDEDGICDNKDNDMDGDNWSNDDELDCATDPADGTDTPIDTDNDTLCDTVDSDDDADSVPDAIEIICGTDPLNGEIYPTVVDVTDTDNDGILNCVDIDDDDDALLDTSEAMLGSDPLVQDTDGDGLLDGVEDADGNGVIDPGETHPAKADTDFDGIDDGVEVASCYPTAIAPDCQATKAWVADTDGDGLLDGAEDTNADGEKQAGETDPTVDDTDGDGAVDGEEVLCLSDPLDATSFPVDKDQSGACDGSEKDSDSDGVADGVETYCGTDPLNADSVPGLDDLDDTDNDGLINCADPDDDDDQVADGPEIECQTDPRDATSKPSPVDIQDYDGDGALNCSDLDDDNDGLSDTDEALRGTDPFDGDSDDDGLSDGDEVHTFLTNPMNPDTDGDGVQDGTELSRVEGHKDTDITKFQPDEDPTTGTDPLKPDTDGDQVIDGEEDANGNGLVDEGEGDPNDPSDGLFDSDGDGLPDRDEIQIYGTDPNLKDTDADGLDDKVELMVHHTDPLTADSDGGGVNDGHEVENGTDPNVAEDDFDGAVLGGDNVFGCQSGDSGVPLVLFTLVLLGLLAWRRKLLHLLVAVFALGLAFSWAPAPSEAATPSLSSQTFFPAGGLYRMWSVEQSQIGPGQEVYGRMLIHGEHESLKLRAGGHQETLIESAQFVNFGVGVGIMEWVQVDLSIPVILSAESGPGVTSVAPLSGAGMGDMSLNSRLRIINNNQGGFGVGASLGLTLPTGDPTKFQGEPNVGVLMNFIGDYRTPTMVISFNTGFRFRAEDAVFLDNTFSHELTFGLGLEARFAEGNFALTTEVFGRTPLTEPFGSLDKTNLEIMFGPKWWATSDFSLQGALAVGLVHGAGTPDFRFLLGLSWAPAPNDADGDGIVDEKDACKFSPEDKDGFADTDGCPEPDNDNDGILDAVDQCPNLAEDFNGHMDEDGCPDKPKVYDKDGDGLPDAIDKCPSLPENFNGFMDGDGCPDEDPIPLSELRKATFEAPKVDKDCLLSIDTPIPFVKGHWGVSKATLPLLDKMASTIKSSPLIEAISVEGHASEEGSEVGNLIISKKRAVFVVNYLTRTHGISRDMFAARGFGEANPKVDARTAEALNKNRRVELKLTLGGKCKK